LFLGRHCSSVLLFTASDHIGDGHCVILISLETSDGPTEAGGLGRLTERVPNVGPNFGGMNFILNLNLRIMGEKRPISDVVCQNLSSLDLKLLTVSASPVLYLVWKCYAYSQYKVQNWVRTSYNQIKSAIQ